jgi:hypothetical protein
MKQPIAWTHPELYEKVVRDLRKAMVPFKTEIGPETQTKMEEACHRALKRLEDTVPEFRRMVPAYEINCDPNTGKLLCSFHMDVPYVGARVILHRPPDQTKEEFEKAVDEILVELYLSDQP